MIWHTVVARVRIPKLILYIKHTYLFDINEGIGLLKLADTVLILSNPSPSNVKRVNTF